LGATQPGDGIQALRNQNVDVHIEARSAKKFLLGKFALLYYTQNKFFM
jgi:hypothetical protein